jgi:hypothetical protein
MLYTNMILNNRWKCIFLLLTPIVIFSVWQGIVKPYEKKRLQVQTVLAADKIVNGFSSQAFENLAAIEQLFTSIDKKHEHYKKTLY